MYCIEYIQSTMTTKELKADNLLLQAKLDDALAEITELKNLVEHMEKEKYNGIECVDEPDETGAFRIDQVNVGYLHRCALEQLSQSLPADFVTAPLDNKEIISIAHDMASYIEIDDELFCGAVDQIVEHYVDVISQKSV